MGLRIEVRIGDIKSWVLDTVWSASPLQILYPESSGRNLVNKLTMILSGPPSWCRHCEDDIIRAKNLFAFVYCLASPVTEFLRILNLVIQTEALFTDKLRGATEIT
jgi:hypothetical protein